MTRVFWGETHLNVEDAAVDSFDACFANGRDHLDFLMLAYYPASFYQLRGGLAVESIGAHPESQASWQRIKELAAKYNTPGEYLTFPGYEWSGDRTRWGDVNVFFYEDGKLDLSDSLPELYEHFKGRKVFLFPHHTGYLPTQRGKDWSCHDETLSPVMEIYSIHGSSECVRSALPMTANPAMGPRTSGGTAQDGLARGLRFGFIASSDNNYLFPGAWGTGLAAVRADTLTREALWDAILHRHTYAVTGDRIELDFTTNDCPMGGELTAKGKLSLVADVRASDAIDRIELIRGGRVIATHFHADSWPVAPDDKVIRFKLRVECGWGPRPDKGFQRDPKDWDGTLRLSDGRVLSVEKCFTYPGQRVERTSDCECAFHLHTPAVMPRKLPFVESEGSQAIVFELEMPRDAKVAVEAGDARFEVTPIEALQRGHLVALTDEVRKKTKAEFNIAPEEVENVDVFYHNAWKMKRHIGAPEASYAVRHVFEDTPPPGHHYYYLRVSQLNGQRAWSSPIWVESRD